MPPPMPIGAPDFVFVIGGDVRSCTFRHLRRGMRSTLLIFSAMHRLQQRRGRCTSIRLRFSASYHLPYQ